MATPSLVDRKLNASRQFTDDLLQRGSPIVAAYWEFVEERDRWIFYVVPKLAADELKVIEQTVKLLADAPYETYISIFDVFVDSRQLSRAKALSSCIRGPRDLGREIGTFADGHYFESAIVVYMAPELLQQYSAV